MSPIERTATTRAQPRTDNEGPTVDGHSRHVVAKCSKRLLFYLILVALFGRCLAQPNASGSRTAAIASALHEGNFNLALRLSQLEVRDHPGDYRIWTLQGLAFTAMAEPAQAEASYRRALKLAPDYLPALEGAAQVELLSGNYSSSEVLVRRILTQRPNDLPAHALFGVIEARKGSCGTALDHFDRAREILGHSWSALTEFGSCLSLANRHQEAIEIFEEVLAHDPTRGEARYNLALAQWRSNKLDEALSTLEPLTTVASSDSQALELSSRILEAQGKTPAATALLQRAMAANPRNASLYLEFASLSFDHSSLPAGIDILDFGIKQMPDEASLYLARGILRAQLGDFVRASEDFDHADRINPRLNLVEVADGVLHSERHEPTAALSHFRAAVKSHPNDAYARYRLAEALLMEGDTAQDRAEALEEAQHSAELDPRSVETQDLLGTLYMERGEREKAIKATRTALALDPDDEQAVYHLIIELRRSSEKDQIPSLVKHLLEIRDRNKSKQTSLNPYRLFVDEHLTGFSAKGGDE